MTPEQLKASILQMAIQGKLVEQRSEEGSADDLYSVIKACQKEKNIKGKTCLAITDDEIPFEIPESWKWVRVSEICSILNGDRGKNYPAKSTLKKEGIPFISALNLDGKTVKQDDSLLCLSDDQYNKLGNGKLIKGDIVVCIRGSLGKHGRYPFDKGAIASSLVICRQFCDGDVMADYFMMYLDAPLFYALIREYDNGTAQPNLAAKSFEQFLFPLPPLTEQKRIVTKIAELLPYVDRYAEAYEKLEQFNAKFPEDMKKSILQYAIQGKLVEQRPEEGTAEELYRQIQDEKQRLIKEGKIKKEKPFAEISEDKVPFDIPDSWKWVYVGELFNHNTGKAMNSSAKKTDKAGSIRKFITTSNVYWNSLDFTNVKEMFFSDDELDRCTISKGDMLMCEGGAYYGRTAIWDYDYNICFQNHVHRLRPYMKMDLLYFYYIFYFYRNSGLMSSKGTAMPGLSSIALHQMLIPLPPLEEQHRIVTKVEELLPYCDRLKE